ncbi:hypothetical protein TH30_10110 [Thalassospira profundimaris]|uniref:Uncharacterized protein n=1 Tax=Thalassospira profundimaris TaxID=502049 RepID=A0A367WXQ3_9PROT|nr:hypothetical protein TH30_10110 [Thalassospira profundimaris]
MTMLTDFQCIKQANRYVPVSLDNRANNSRNDGNENVAIGHKANLWVCIFRTVWFENIPEMMKAITGSENQ